MQYFVNIVTIINFLFIIAMIFIERKKPEIIVSWLLLFAFLPLIGFFLYVLIGGGLSIKTKRMLKRKRYYDDNFKSYYKKFVDEDIKYRNKQISKLIKYNIINAESVPTFNNSIKFLTNGKDKIESLKKDIKKAKHSINMEYYIFADDFVGKEIMDLLCEKAREGVKVKLIYDSVGCLGTPRRFFRKLRKAGGEVKEFFPPLFYIRLINLKMNYRNHRKIVVIDGKIGYVGGINIRKDHLGYNKKTSPWRDTHIRVVGDMVYSLQNTFLNFWEFCNKKVYETQKYVKEGYFPTQKYPVNIVGQVITSGPNDEHHRIKEAMIKMISMAEKEIILETPYFIPDDVFMEAFKQAINSGITVKIIIPGKPDKKMIYLATLSYIKDLLKLGAEIYLYDGFIHAKTLVVDNLAMCVGTCNADNRSFSLNFEITALIYDKKTVEEYTKICYDDMNNSKKINIGFYTRKHIFSKFGQVIFRLFSPLF